MGAIGVFLVESITLGISVFYPAYQSFKAINSGEETKQLEWLMYWTVSGFFTFAEHWFGLLFSWLPLYYEAKLLAMIWLSIGGGAAAIYRGFLHSYLLSHEREIDNRVRLAARQARASVANVGVSMLRFTRERSASVLKSVTERMVLDQWTNVPEGSPSPLFDLNKSIEGDGKGPAMTKSRSEAAAVIDAESEIEIEGGSGGDLPPAGLRRRVSQPSLPFAGNARAGAGATANIGQNVMPRIGLIRSEEPKPGQARSTSAFLPRPRRTIVDSTNNATGPVRARRTQRLAEMGRRNVWDRLRGKKSVGGDDHDNGNEMEEEVDK